MARTLLYIIGAINVVNGVIMFILPMTWYEAVPGVAAMGPFNLHFVRDIGLIYLMCGIALGWAAQQDNREVGITGAAWTCLHALFHVQIWFARGLPFDFVAFTNLTGIQIPAWLSLYAAFQLTSRKAHTP